MNLRKHLLFKTFVPTQLILLFLVGIAFLIPDLGLKALIGALAVLCELIVFPIYLFTIHLKERLRNGKTLFLLNLFLIEASLLLFPVLAGLGTAIVTGRTFPFTEKSSDPESNIIYEAVTSFHLYSILTIGILSQIFLVIYSLVKKHKVKVKNCGNPCQ